MLFFTDNPLYDRSLSHRSPSIYDYTSKRLSCGYALFLSLAVSYQVHGSLLISTFLAHDFKQITAKSRKSDTFIHRCTLCTVEYTGIPHIIKMKLSFQNVKNKTSSSIILFDKCQIIIKLNKNFMKNNLRRKK